METAMTTPAGRSVKALLSHDGLELWRVLPEGNFYIVELTIGPAGVGVVKRMTGNLMMGEAGAILRMPARINSYREELR